MSAVAMKQAAAGAGGAGGGGGGGGAGGKHDVLEGEFLGLCHSPPQFTPSSYEMTHHKRVRSGSISGRLRSASELEEKGLIDRVQKGALKDLILSGDEQLLSALDKFAVEGDAQELKALLRSGLLEGQHGDLDLDLLVDDLDLNFLQLSHSLGADALGGDGHHGGGGGGDAYVQFAMDDVASFLVGDAPLPAATHTAVATAAAAASSSGAAHAGGPASAGSAAASSGAKAAAGGGKKKQETPQRLQQPQQKRPPPSSQPSSSTGASAGAGAGDEQDLLSAMGDRVASTLGRNRSMSLTHASTLVSFGVSPFEHGDDVGALAGMFIKEEHPPTMAAAGGGQEGKGPAVADAGEDNSLAASLMPKAATPGSGGRNGMSGVTVKTQPPSNHKTGGGAGARPGTPNGTTKPVVLPLIPVAIGKDGQPLAEREEGKQYVGAYSPESRRQRLERFWEKKKRRIWDRKVKYDVRKNFADSRIRVKGRFVKKEDEAILLEVSTLTGGAGAGPGGAQQSPEAAAAGELAALMGDEDALAALEGLGTMGGGGSSASNSDSNLLHHHHHLAPSPSSPPGSPVIPALDP